MGTVPFAPSEVHNAACERAHQADCKCHCRGAGHQFDLVVRAVKCASASDQTDLEDSLEEVYGGFHSSVRDVSTATRVGRWIPASSFAAAMRLEVGRGASWYEQLLVDEALHCAFIDVAIRSRLLTAADRDSQVAFVTDVTRKAITVVQSTSSSHDVVESHVWCSLVSEFVRSRGPVPIPQHPQFGKICYPRRSVGRRPTGLDAVRAAGIAHLGAAFSACGSLSTGDRERVLCLVGAATCPDLWHHPAAVRYCLQPFVDAAAWPPPVTTRIALPPSFSDLGLRWSRRRNW